jgi:N4-gp56 family major capsid protein
MATGNMTTTTLDAFIPEVWSKEVILTAIAASVITPLVRTDWDGEIREEGDVVHIPLLSAVTIGDKQANTAVTYTNYTESTQDITIDKHKYFAFRVEDIARVQSKPELLTAYAGQGGKGLGKQMDTDVSLLVNNASVTQNVGATTSGAYSDITDAVIRNAIQLLDEANAPEEDRFLLISPAQKNALLGIDKFVEANKIGDNTVIRKGLFGEIYGVMIYVSNNLPSTTSVASSSGASAILAAKNCIMFQREGIGLATQLNPRVQSAYDIDHLATSVVGDVLYGAGLLVPAFVVDVRCTAE